METPDADRPVESEPESEPESGGADKDASAHALERAKHDLETQIERAVANYEHAHDDEPLEVNLNFESEDLSAGESDQANEQLQREIRSLVEDFHRTSAVSGSGVHVQRLTAIDSDADGEVAVRVHYDYAGYQ